ncbi:MAG: ORF6N domain-containing protein [Pirellulales bacterium]
MAKKAPSTTLATADQIERAIHIIRGQRVMLDSDLATLYGVTTAQLNQQVSRNPDRFPEDFSYQLTAQEFTSLMSQFVISKKGRGGRRKLPRVFTEQGVAMLSSVLNSPTAVHVNIEIMRTFVRLRRLMATPGELVEQLTKLAETVQLHDDQIKVISQVLQQMLEKPVESKRKIAFHTTNSKLKSWLLLLAVFTHGRPDLR